MAKKRKRKLTPLQLHKIRVRAGKKAAKTLKKRMKEEPEFRAYIQEVYKKAGERLKQYNKERKKNKDTEDYTDDIPVIDYEEYTDEETMNEYNNAVSNEEISEVMAILNNIMDIITHGYNENTCEFMQEILQKNIPLDMENQREYVDGIKNSSDELLDRAEIVAYDSKEEEVRANAHPLAKILAPNGYDVFGLDKAISEDFDLSVFYEKRRQLRVKGKPIFSNIPEDK